MHPGIMKNQSKSLSALVVTRREPQSRRGRLSKQLDAIHQVVFCHLFDGKDNRHPFLLPIGRLSPQTIISQALSILAASSSPQKWAVFIHPV